MLALFFPEELQMSSCRCRKPLTASVLDHQMVHLYNIFLWLLWSFSGKSCYGPKLCTFSLTSSSVEGHEVSIACRHVLGWLCSPFWNAVLVHSDDMPKPLYPLTFDVLHHTLALSLHVKFFIWCFFRQEDKVYFPGLILFMSAFTVHQHSKPWRKTVLALLL